jgi:toxin-antitoxin system PIN domain toxin
LTALDTNILVYAHRADAHQHAPALNLLRTLAEGEQPWAIPFLVLVEFVRVVTHRRFAPPSTPEAAFDWIESLRESPSLHILMPGARFFPLYSRLSLEAKAAGNLAFDAAIVALCLEHGVSQLVTEDRDFRRFGKELKIVSLPA